MVVTAAACDVATLQQNVRCNRRKTKVTKKKRYTKKLPGTAVYKYDHPSGDKNETPAVCCFLPFGKVEMTTETGKRKRKHGKTGNGKPETQKRKRGNPRPALLFFMRPRTRAKTNVRLNAEKPRGWTNAACLYIHTSSGAGDPRFHASITIAAIDFSLPIPSLLPPT